MSDKPVPKVVKPIPADLAKPAAAAAPKVVAPVAAKPAEPAVAPPPPPPPPAAPAGNSFVSPYPINGEDGLSLADPVAGEPPVNQLFRTVMKHKGSDLHLKAGLPAAMRLRGVIQRMATKPLSQEDMEKLLYPIISEKQRKNMEEKGGADFAHVIGNDEARYRVNILKQRGKLALVARLVNSSIPDFENLGLPPSIEKLCHFEQGLVILAGVTGSGKSTTIASMLEYMNKREALHILTIEDPIEFVFTDKMSIVNQREVFLDVSDWHTALKHAVREDPDVILVGEMRDLETIHAAIEAAETGHIVFGTLHTSGAASTINRIIDVFPKDQQDQVRTQLSTALMGVLSQSLLPRIPESVIAAYEMMVVTPAIANLIRENKVYRIDSAIQTGRKEGMFLLDESLFRLWKDGLCAKEEVLLKAAKPNELAAKIAAAERGDDDEEEDDDEDEDEDEDDEDEDDRRRRRR